MSASPANQSQQVLSAVALMLGAMAILPIMDSAAKHLGMFMPVAMCVWARFFFQSAFVAPVVIRKYGPGILWPKDASFQISRSLCLVCANGAFFLGLRYLPLADMLALFFISPILVTALSPFVLGEKVDAKRWLAVLGGFAGVLVIIRPGFAELNAGTALGLLSGVLYAVFVLLTRRIRGLPVLVTTLYNALPGAIAVTLAAPLFWQWPTPEQWLLPASALFPSAPITCSSCHSKGRQHPCSRPLRIARSSPAPSSAIIGLATCPIAGHSPVPPFSSRAAFSSLGMKPAAPSPKCWKRNRLKASSDIR